MIKLGLGSFTFNVAVLHLACRVAGEVEDSVGGRAIGIDLVLLKLQSLHVKPRIGKFVWRTWAEDHRLLSYG